MDDVVTIFFKAIQDNVLADGVITGKEAAWLRKAIMADGKVDQRPRCLGAVVALARHLDGAHAVGFGACWLAHPVRISRRPERVVGRISNPAAEPQRAGLEIRPTRNRQSPLSK